MKFGNSEPYIQGYNTDFWLFGTRRAKKKHLFSQHTK